MRTIRAFSLIELLAAIAVTILLVAITIPTLSTMRAVSSTTQCISNLRQIGAAALLYAEDNNGEMMQTDHTYPQRLWNYVYGDSRGSTISITGNPPTALVGTVFECPNVYDDDAKVLRSYGVNICFNPDFVVRMTGATSTSKVIKPALIPAPSQTVLFGDALSSSNLNPATLNRRHSSRVNIVYMDGHTQSIQPTPAQLQNGNIRIAFWLGRDR